MNDSEKAKKELNLKIDDKKNSTDDKKKNLKIVVKENILVNIHQNYDVVNINVVNEIQAQKIQERPIL